MIDYYVHQNITKWLSKDIEFNDLIRRIADNSETDVKLRYETEDKFGLHVEDLSYSKTRKRFLYPFIGIDYLEYNADQTFVCPIEINIMFTIIAYSCSKPSLDTGGCSITVKDPRLHINKLSQKITKIFDFSLTESDGTVRQTNIFNELRCTPQDYWDCDTESSVNASWKYNIWANLKRSPIFSPITVREDDAVQRNITIPLVITSVADESYCIDGCI